MEFSKTQRSALLVSPTRWPPIVLGLIVGLFISAFCTSNFAMRSVVPTHISSSSLSVPSSLFRPFSSATSPSINQLFIQLLFKSSPMQQAARQEESFVPGAHTSSENAFKPYLEESVDSSQRTDEFLRDASIVAESEYMKHQALSLQEMMAETRNDVWENKRAQANEIAGHVKKELNAAKPSFYNDPTSSLADHGQKHANKEFVESISYGFKLSHGDTTHKTVQAHRNSSSSSKSDNLKCDISKGRWVEDDTYPLYDPGSCPFVDEGFSCHSNGRPDAKYAKWRWAPRDCNVPRFNGTYLLERLRGRRMVFVGDSLNRNQWESMLCMLRESLSDKGRIVQVQGSRISKLPGAYAFKFLDYNCRVEFYTSPYLVDKEEGSEQVRYIIKLDKMDKAERRWRKADVLVFNTGHWWTPDKIGDGANCFQEGNEVYTKLDVMVAYNKALSTWARWVDRYINPQNTSVFFRGYSPVHYTGGQWNSGGQCQNETEPIYKESYLTAYPDKMQALERVLQGMRVPVHVLNITRLSDYRKDGHPAVFGHPPHQVVSHQDCSHWCLPGLPDTWNELLSFALIKQSMHTSHHN